MTLDKSDRSVAALVTIASARFDPVIIDSVCRIANHDYKQRGYMTHISPEDTAAVLNAAQKLCRLIASHHSVWGDCHIQHNGNSEVV